MDEKNIATIEGSSNRGHCHESNLLQLTKWQITKNLIVISLGFVLLFTSYNGLSMLQSTMNQAQGIGVVSQAITYASFGLSALVLPKYVIKKLGCRYSLLATFTLYVPYIAANSWFNWATMVPSALLVGLASAVLWSAQCTYFNQLSEMYSRQLVFGQKAGNSQSQLANNLVTNGGSIGCSRDKQVIGDRLNDERSSKAVAVIPSNPFDGGKASSIHSDCTRECGQNFLGEQKGLVIISGKSGESVLISAVTDRRDTSPDCKVYLNAAYYSSEDLRGVDGKVPDNQIRHEDKQFNFNNAIAEDRKTDLPQPENNEISKEELKSSEILHLNAHISEMNSYNELKSAMKVQKTELDQHLIKLQAETYARTLTSITARFFGLFGMIFRTSDVWSNLMSYYVLKDDSFVLDNITLESNCSCGAYFCNDESQCFERNLAEPSQYMRNVLTGTSVALAVLAILLVLLFLDELERGRKPISFSFQLAMATCNFSMRRDALLLLPLSAYIGLQQGFYIGDFTKSYIACAWGVYHVGLVTITYGASAGLSSSLSGFLVKHVGRVPVMLAAGLVNLAVNVLLLAWRPLPDQPVLLFVAAGLWGMAVGTFWSQLRGFYGVLFSEDAESAFASFYLWDAFGYCAAFSYSNYICTYIKLYILLAASTLGMAGYLLTERMLAGDSKRGEKTDCMN